jgi:hypothetical protein
LRGGVQTSLDLAALGGGRERDRENFGAEEGEYLSDAELAEFAADLGIVDPGAESGEPADTTTPPLP